MHFLHAINSDRQTRLLNVCGQITMFLEIKKKNEKNKAIIVRSSLKVLDLVMSQ